MAEMVEVRLCLYEVFSLLYPYDGQEIRHRICEYWSLSHDGREGAVEVRERQIAAYRKENTEAVVMIREAWITAQKKISATKVLPEILPIARRPLHTR